MSERKLTTWHKAGLIDAVTVTLIRNYEAEHSRPLAIWAVIGIGALAIGLGIISIVAANWEDVPGTVRLAIHLAAIIGLGGFIALRAGQLAEARPWALEAALFVFAILGMSFFGHLGQVYQTSSPLWKPLAAWLVLFAPLVLLRGQSWLTAALLVVGLIYACWDYAATFDSMFGRTNGYPALWIALVTALPMLVAVLRGAMQSRSSRDAFWRRMEQIALAYAIGGASLIAIIAGIDDFNDDSLSFGSQVIRGGVALSVTAAVVLMRNNSSGQSTGLVFAGAGLTCILAFVTSGNDLGAGILFMAFWIGIGAASLRAGWRGTFQLAVAVVAIRLIVLSFELASDLLTSGFGLILAGMFILAIAWAAVQVSRNFAPPREELAQ